MIKLSKTQVVNQAVSMAVDSLVDEGPTDGTRENALFVLGERVRDAAEAIVDLGLVVDDAETAKQMIAAELLRRLLNGVQSWA